MNRSESADADSILASFDYLENKVRQLAAIGLKPLDIARQLNMHETQVRAVLTAKPSPENDHA